MLNFYDFIHVCVFTTNHHLNKTVNGTWVELWPILHIETFVIFDFDSFLT